MRTELIGLVLLLGAAGLGQVLALTLGAAPPSSAVKMKCVDGRELSLTDAKGAKGLLVVFTCNHCPYVKAWETRIASLGNEFAARGVGVIAVNPNDPAQYPEDGFEPMQQRARERGFAFPYVVDATSGVARAFGATRTPEAFLFDATGRLVYHGTIDDNGEDEAKVTKPYLRDALEAVAAGKAPAVAETKSIGCSIKFRN
jgi:peroxiredoxin